MTEQQKCNGWANYETWCVNLWLTNEPASDEQLTKIIKAHKEDGEAAQAVKEWVADDYILNGAPDLPPGLASDLVRAALGEVDWLEIVQNHREDK